MEQVMQTLHHLEISPLCWLHPLNIFVERLGFSFLLVEHDFAESSNVLSGFSLIFLCYLRIDNNKRSCVDSIHEHVWKITSSVCLLSNSSIPFLMVKTLLVEIWYKYIYYDCIYIYKWSYMILPFLMVKSCSIYMFNRHSVLPKTWRCPSSKAIPKNTRYMGGIKLRQWEFYCVVGVPYYTQCVYIYI